MTEHRQALNETKVVKHLDSIKSDHPGSKLVRKMLDTFEIDGAFGPHVCIAHKPLRPSLRSIRIMAGGEIPKDVRKPMFYGLLLGLDYLHSEARVVHTGMNTILQAAYRGLP
jgi:hypothetical protein